MKVGIMQPYFLPYLGYFQLINAVDRFVVLDDVNYIKKGYINRNQILLNKKAHQFTLPLEKASQNKLINEISLSSNQKEISKQLRMFEMAYRKAPYFEDVYPIIEDVYSSKELSLSKFVVNSINKICNYLSIETEIIESSSNFFKNGLKGEDRIIDIVKKNEGTTYINAIGGRDLYNKNNFESNSVRLYFIEQNNIVYKQYSNDFLPNLSIIDVLMFNREEDCRNYLNNYNLV